MPLAIDARPFDRNVASSFDAVPADAIGGRDYAFAAADAAVFIQFPVTRRRVATRMMVSNGTVASGNTRMGIYDASGALLASTAATAQSGTSAQQVIALSASVTLAPGLYFMALSNSGTTGLYAWWNVSPSESNVGAYGVRAAASGGIVTTPTIVDPTTAHVTKLNGVPIMSVLGYGATELAAA